MKLELLANELLLELFEYLSFYDLIHGFYNLNSRFNNLLTNKYKFCLNLQSLSKTKCTDICENLVPLILDQISSLCLSNDDDTPYEIELFLSQTYQLRQFTHLQSITLSNIISIDILNQFMMECIYLPHLMHLSIHTDYIKVSQSDTDHLYNQIWNLKNLTDCFINLKTRDKVHFPTLKFISTTLKNFTDVGLSFSFSTLNDLFQNTPNLEYLSITFEDRSDQFGVIIPMLSLTRANIDFRYGYIDTLEHFFQNMPNLSHLTLDLYRIYVDGHEWEEIISKYLLKLKVFQFRATVIFWDGEKFTMKSDEIIETYRTKFWLEERRWFVRCEFNISNDIQIACFDIFTLPYNFNDYFHRHHHFESASTNPSNENYSMDRVNSISYENNFPPRNIQFPNIKCLGTSCPFDDDLFTVISKFDRLNSLYIHISFDRHINYITSQLQLIVNQAPRLRLLSLMFWEQSGNSRMLLKEIASNSIRQLAIEIRHHTNFHNDEDCIHLSHSSLGQQCETLSIEIKNRKSILDLIAMMPNLQALKVQCHDDTFPWRKKEDETLQDNENDEMIEWLQNQLPSTFLIRRKTLNSCIIRIWIR